jgi:hypothetical protein
MTDTTVKTDKDCKVTRTYSVTPQGYELTMSVHKSHWEGDKYVTETLTVKTLRPHAFAITAKEIAEVVANYEVA